MDDMDFGVDTLAKAKSVLRDLDLALHTRNIRLNSGKTKIMTGTEALRYFRVSENVALLALMDRIKAAHGYPKFHLYGRLIRRSIASGIRKKDFDEGSGGKILKRLLGLVYRHSFAIDDESFRDILYNRPALRDYLLRGWIRSPNYRGQIAIVLGYLGSGQAIDDYSSILISVAISSAVHPTALPSTVLHELVFHLKGDNPFHLYARLLIVSRLDTPSRLIAEVKKTQSSWAKHTFLSRLVASFYGIFLYTPHYMDFENLVRRHGGIDALSVFDFHEAIATDKSTFYSAKAFIEAGNPSLPIAISHSKVLMLATALWNGNIPKIDRAKLLGKHSLAMSDTYYRQLLSGIISAAP